MKQTNSFKEDASFDDDDFDIQACATTDCTGLIPSLPQSEAEAEAYNELYSYLPEIKNRQD